jgi:polyhydroxybutyrate depolymerase
MPPPSLRISAPWAALALLAVLAAGLWALPVRTAEGTPAEPPCAAAAAGVSTAITIRSGAVDRRALVHVPAHRADRKMAVVMVLHGAQSDGPSMERYSGMTQLSDERGFIVVYPSAAAPLRSWRIGATDPHARDDLAFIEALLDRLGEEPCATAGRVFVTGVSNGGGMTARIGCELSDRVAAIAPVAGGYKSLPACRPSRPIPVLEIHGMDDPVVPYRGVPPERRGDVVRYLRAWARTDGCAMTANRRTLNASTERLMWTGCKPGIWVSHLRLKGAGHLWPGYEDGEPWPRAADSVWDFFDRVGR